uniref:Transducer of regulated CREB activity middle domain-containing protein n=1 Tax=Timema poppense TaxID=170557 RepID=A0A7R9H3I7_TIMPO|nr:unnamed protein product [Timema poppensis]
MNALSNLEEIKSGRVDAPIVYQERGRRMGVGPMRSRPNEKRIDTSPYSNSGGAYLSPPPDTSWRRTNSDSALHQSAMNMGGEPSLHSPGSQRRVTDGQLLGIMTSDQCDHGRKHLGTSPDGRPRSCCEVPRVPGINIYPSQQEPGTVQIPIGNNTGSLPDLTSFQFSSPLHTPLDQEDHSSSPYSTSPQGASPSTLSPTSLSSRPMGRFSFTGSPQDSQGPSPGHSPSTRRRHYSQPLPQNLIIGGPPSPTQLAQTLGTTLTRHLTRDYRGSVSNQTVRVGRRKMVYSIEEHGFIVPQYWVTDSFKQCQRRYLNKFGGHTPPTRTSNLAKKLERTRNMVDPHSGERTRMTEDNIQDVKQRLLASQRK